MSSTGTIITDRPWMAKARKAGRVLATLAYSVAFLNTATWVSHNWGTFSSAKEISSIALLVVFPLPCIHLWGKRQDTLTVAASALAALILFQSLLYH